MDWIIGIVVPEETIFHNGRMLNTIILAVMLLALLAIYFFCRRTIKDTTTPSRPIRLPSTGRYAKATRPVCSSPCSSACLTSPQAVSTIAMPATSHPY